jgi:hypothetical protein
MEVNMVSLQIQSEGDMVRLLSFLHDTKIQFRVEDPVRFERILYQAIDGDKVNPAWLRNRVFDDILTDIEEKLLLEHEDGGSSKHDTTELEEGIKMIADFRSLVRKEHTPYSMRVLYKPTEHFKEFCGGEWLTQKGFISPHTAVTFLEYNIQKRGIRVTNGVIYTTEWLRAVLEDTRETIYHDELPILVNKLLKSS